jgi:hypothetical protein
MFSGPLHVLYTPSEKELDPGGHREWWPCASFSRLFSLRFKGSLEMGSCEDRWKILRENTVRFLVNAPADFWSKRPGTRFYTDERKKNKRGRGEKKEKKIVELFICYVFFFSFLSSP